MDAAREISLFVRQMVDESWAHCVQNDGLALVCKALRDAGFVVDGEEQWTTVGIGMSGPGGRSGTVLVRDPVTDSAFVLRSELKDQLGPPDAEYGVLHSWRLLQGDSRKKPGFSDFNRTLVIFHLNHFGVSAQMMADFKVGTGAMQAYFRELLNLPELAVTPEQAAAFVTHIVSLFAH